MITKCHLCHGKGTCRLITRMTFGPDSEIESRTETCRVCRGEGNVYIVPASKAPEGIIPNVSE